MAVGFRRHDGRKRNHWPIWVLMKHTHPTKENDMNYEEQGMNDAMQNRDMSNDPKWSQADREKYQAAYTNAKKKQESGQA
jgi:hypothetical protein